MQSSTFRVIDSHTGGEPTRVIVSGGPDLESDALSVRRELMRSKFDHYRTALCNEPRGSDVMVGAILCEPLDRTCAAGVIFFNNVGYLNMCGHGTIGLVETLRYLGRMKPGTHRIETPVGNISATLHEDGRVSIQNVPAYRHRADVEIDVPKHGKVIGDIAWGGNWFYLVKNHDQDVSLHNVENLTNFTRAIRHALDAGGITGADGGEIDHIEVFAPVDDGSADSINFVLCPGMAYDRSPCGTGTSAKIACLAADGKLKPGQIWRQKSIVGSVFDASYQIVDNQIIPTITGRAFVNAEMTVILDPHDPFAYGISSRGP